MAEERVQRRLAAVLAADVVGFSRLMGEDEAGTLADLKDHRKFLIDPTISELGGRTVKLMGDGSLVEFASVVDAVECAVTIQRGMVERNNGVPEDRRIYFRIGINLGDIIVDGDDIYGDGINVVARLEALAEPGGICISRAAHEQVRDKLDYFFRDGGEQALKNIARPIHVYRFSEIGGDAATTAPVSNQTKPRTLDAIFGWLRRPPSTAVASNTPPTLDRPILSIAVLPFENLSGDPDQDYFADALTEDITGDLSRISGSFVIARATAATFRGQSIDAKSVADELNVRYLLEGTVRRAGQNVRVNAHLTDGKNGQQLWSDRYEKSAGDMYTFQNEVTGRVARALNLELKEAVSRQVESRQHGQRGAGLLDSDDLTLRAWAELWTKPQTPETNRAGLEYVRRALELNPNNSEALGVATYAYARAATYGWGMAREDAIKKGLETGERSVALDHKNADAVFAFGFINYAAGETQKSLELMRQCIDLNRNHAPAYFFTGVNHIRLGKSREAIEWVARAFALSPRDPLQSVWYAIIGRALIILGDDEQAVEAAEKGVASNRNHSHNYAVLAAAYAHLDQMDKARSALDNLKRVSPNVTFSEYSQLLTSTDPKAIESYRRILEGLRKAGLAD